MPTHKNWVKAIDFLYYHPAETGGEICKKGKFVHFIVKNIYIFLPNLDNNN